MALQPPVNFFGPDDPTGTALVQMFLDDMLEQFVGFVNMLYPEVSPGVRMPLFHNDIPEEIIYFRLEEAKRKFDLQQRGQYEGDEDTARFAQNEGGAQQRLLELREKYTAMREGAADGSR